MIHAVTHGKLINTQRLIISFSADMIHAVTHGKLINTRRLISFSADMISCPYSWKTDKHSASYYIFLS